MAAFGPGNDNVTGDRATLDVGMEPDLGNMLKNFQLANDLADAMVDKFNTINSIVRSTTQTLGQATRQTQLMTAETQRLQNAYQGIAASSYTLSNIGGMAGGYPGGMMPYGYPGQMAFGGMPYQQQQQQANIIDTGGESTRPSEDIPEFRTSSAPKPNFPLSVRAASLQQLEQHARPGSLLGNSINKFRTGYSQGILKGWGSATGAKVPGTGTMYASAEEAMAAGVPAEALTDMGAAGVMAGGVEAGLLGGVGATIGTIAPYAAAAYASYKLVAGQIAESRRLSGITGGTGIFDGVGGGTLALKGRSLYMGLTNPGVDYGRVQEEALGTGAIGGTYTATRDYLFQAAKRGMSDAIDQVDMYREVVQKAGGSTAELTNALDSMANVAATSNASLTVLQKNLKANVETFVALGMGGDTAVAAGLLQATANARYSPVAQANPALITSNGYDISNPYLRAQMTGALGINYNQLGTTTTLNPVMAGNIPQMAEHAAVKGLGMYGFKNGMMYQDVIKQMQNSGLGDMTGQVLQQMGLIPPDIDPNNLRDVAMSIQTTLGQPIKAATKAMNSAGDEQALGTYQDVGGGWKGALAGFAGNVAGTVLTGGGGGGVGPAVGGGVAKDTVVSTQAQNAKHYVENTLGIEMQGGGVFSLGQHDNAWNSLAKTYEAQISQTGKTSPIFDAILGGMQGGGESFMVRGPDGKAIDLQTFMSQHGDWQDLLRKQKSGYQIASLDPSKQAALANATTQTQKDQITSDLGWGTGDQLAAGKLPNQDPNDVHSEGSQGEFDLGDKTLERMGQLMKDAQNQ